MVVATLESSATTEEPPLPTMLIPSCLSIQPPRRVVILCLGQPTGWANTCAGIRVNPSATTTRVLFQGPSWVMAAMALALGESKFIQRFRSLPKA